MSEKFEDKDTGEPTRVTVKTFGTKTPEPFVVLRVVVGGITYEFLTTEPDEFFAEVAKAKDAWYAGLRHAMVLEATTMPDDASDPDITKDWHSR